MHVGVEPPIRGRFYVQPYYRTYDKYNKTSIYLLYVYES